MRFAKSGMIAVALVAALVLSFMGRKPVKEVPPALVQSALSEPSAEAVVQAARAIRATLADVSRAVERGEAALDAAETQVERNRVAVAEIRESDEEYDRGKIDAKQYLHRRNEVTARAIAGLEAK